MATYCPEDLASRELSCPICFEDYDIHDDKRSPKLLLCLHTFCLDCTSKLWKSDGSIECSLCRMLHEGVRLEDLLDNHVIVQHLRRECEKQDLELARRIDQELRDLDSLAPAGESDITEIKAMFEKKSFDTPDITEVVNISSEQEQEEEEEDPEDQEENRHYILNNLLEEFMERLNSPRMHINPESEDNEEDSDDRDDDDENSEEHEEIQEVEAQEEENDGDPEEEEATNPFYSLHNIHSLLEEAEEDNTGDIYEVQDIQTILNMTENEENDADDDDEEEDERWHSASDELNAACWNNHENLQLDDVNEMEDDTPEIYDWHIINSESLLDD